MFSAHQCLNRINILILHDVFEVSLFCLFDEKEEEKVDDDAEMIMMKKKSEQDGFKSRFCQT